MPILSDNWLTDIIWNSGTLKYKLHQDTLMPQNCVCVGTDFNKFR